MAQVLPCPRIARQTTEHWLLPAPALEQWWAAGTVERDAIIAANKSDDRNDESLPGDAQESEPQAYCLRRTTAQDSFAEEFETPNACWLQRTTAQDFVEVQEFETPTCWLRAPEALRLAEEPIVHLFDEFEDVEFQPEVNAEAEDEVPAEDDDLGEIPPPQALTRSDGNVTFAEGDPEAYHPLAGFPAEDDDLGEIPPRPTWEQFPRLISDYDKHGYIARTQEEMDAVLAAHEAEQAAAHEAEQAAAHEAAEWTAFLKERQQKKREWNKLHGLSWQRSSYDESDEEYEDYDYDDELPDGNYQLEYRLFRLERDPSYRDGHEFQVPPAQEKLYLEFRATEIEIGRWSEPGLAELRKAWEAFLAARGLEIVLG
jgi:hypothetical protein